MSGWHKDLIVIERGRDWRVCVCRSTHRATGLAQEYHSRPFQPQSPSQQKQQKHIPISLIIDLSSSSVPTLPRTAHITAHNRGCVCVMCYEQHRRLMPSPPPSPKLPRARRSPLPSLLLIELPFPRPTPTPTCKQSHARPPNQATPATFDRSRVRTSYRNTSGGTPRRRTTPWAPRCRWSRRRTSSRWPPCWRRRQPPAPRWWARWRTCTAPSACARWGCAPPRTG
mmetsp:Transcript_21839/g.54063  ORF Transcript_21839/g.54063 Transcript_21839/m.54063 type:complete len:226 (-) Transcript_21839:356-1033(-)